MLPRNASKERGPLLAEGRVDVWLFPIAELTDDKRIEYETILIADERAHASRYLVQHARDQFVAARALLRTRLSAYTGEATECWRFDRNAYGRPHLSAPFRYRDIRFNVSHTEGLVACGFTLGRELGVDVEETTRAVDVLALAREFFAPPEVEALANCSSERHRAMFFSYWTLKEAYVKARGMGMSLPFDAFWFQLGEPPRLHCDPRCDDAFEHWHFLQIRATERHLLAIAVEAMPNEQLQIDTHWLAPQAIIK